jgi:hypothetical protein
VGGGSEGEGGGREVMVRLLMDWLEFPPYLHVSVQIGAKSHHVSKEGIE